MFLDEPGITTNLLRWYGRAPRGARVHDHAPCGRWQTSTFLAALRVTGLTAPGVFNGAIDGESFRAYIEQIDLPPLNRSSRCRGSWASRRRRAAHWRAQFLAAGQAGLKSRAPDARDDDHRRLQAKIGELLMETELLYAKVDQLEAGRPLARRRSTR